MGRRHISGPFFCPYLVEYHIILNPFDDHYKYGISMDGILHCVRRDGKRKYLTMHEFEVCAST